MTGERRRRDDDGKGEIVVVFGVCGGGSGGVCCRLCYGVVVCEFGGIWRDGEFCRVVFVAVERGGDGE